MKTPEEIASEYALVRFPKCIDYPELDDYKEERDGCVVGFIKGYNYDKWIKCVDKMPETPEQHNDICSSGRLLVFGSEGIEVCEYVKHKNYNGYWYGCQGDITHWMETPQQPQ